MDQPKMERLLRLMVLLTDNRKYTIHELSKMLGLSPRSLYRYLDTFRHNGFIIAQENDCFRIERDSPFIKEISQLVFFTEDEVMLLRKGIDGLDDNTIIKYHLREKLNKLYNYTYFEQNIITHPQDSRNLSILRDAILERRQVILHNYQSGNSNNISDRLVEPFKFTENLIQVWCYEPSSAKNKLFKLTRIENVQITDIPFKYEECHHANELDIFRMEGTDPLEIEITMSLRAANLLREEYPKAGNYLFKQSGNSYMLKTEVNSLNGITRFIMGLYNEIYAIKPDFLVEHINSVAEQYAGHKKHKN